MSILGGIICGICGYINASEKIYNDRIIKEMTNSINKKSPNDSNIFIDKNIALGSTKANILDLLNL